MDSIVISNQLKAYNEWRRNHEAALTRCVMAIAPESWPFQPSKRLPTLEPDQSILQSPETKEEIHDSPSQPSSSQKIQETQIKFKSREFKIVKNPERPVIVLLGSTGSGKTAFINRLANLLNYKTVDEAIQRPMYPAPENDNNENPTSVPITQKPHVYDFEGLQSSTFTVIDVPGCDTDPKNMQSFNFFTSILCTNFSQVNAICLFFPLENGSKEVLYILTRYLALIPKSAWGNVFFIATSTSMDMHKQIVQAHSMLQIFCMHLRFVLNPIQFIPFCIEDMNAMRNTEIWQFHRTVVTKLLLIVQRPPVTPDHRPPVSTINFFYLHKAQSVLRYLLTQCQNLQMTTELTVPVIVQSVSRQLKKVNKKTLQNILLQVVKYVYFNESANIYASTAHYLDGSETAQQWICYHNICKCLNSDPLPPDPNFHVVLDEFVKKNLDEKIQSRLRFVFNNKLTKVVPTSSFI